MGKKDKAVAHAYIEITPGFDEADAAIDAFAQKVQARVAKAVADGISDGIRKALPTPRPLATRGVYDQGGMVPSESVIFTNERSRPETVNTAEQIAKMVKDMPTFHGL